jgi:hypothetical protein
MTISVYIDDLFTPGLSSFWLILLTSYGNDDALIATAVAAITPFVNSLVNLL